MINTVDENVTPGISVQAPAPAVSSVKVVAAQIKSDGRKQDNIPQFSTECVTQENENINPYMAEADFDEKAFGMILLRMKE